MRVAKPYEMSDAWPILWREYVMVTDRMKWNQVLWRFIRWATIANETWKMIIRNGETYYAEDARRIVDNESDILITLDGNRRMKYIFIR